MFTHSFRCGQKSAQSENGSTEPSVAPITCDADTRFGLLSAHRSGGGGGGGGLVVVVVVVRGGGGGAGGLVVVGSATDVSVNASTEVETCTWDSEAPSVGAASGGVGRAHAATVAVLISNNRIRLFIRITSWRSGGIGWALRYGGRRSAAIGVARRGLWTSVRTSELIHTSSAEIVGVARQSKAEVPLAGGR
ncbi:hypothetical protein FKR81_13005 [Lentzea tibetensis]|uniref:Uncharacterized protein n=1 Tax=Lentzea tibetensis TaxID=2591470 RepID=A0A563EVP8_9PSEU|nr:hypothetical protein FKR81_13005 [Lentzea tibetensis]